MKKAVSMSKCSLNLLINMNIIEYHHYESRYVSFSQSLKYKNFLDIDFKNLSRNLLTSALISLFQEHPTGCFGRTTKSNDNRMNN